MKQRQYLFFWALLTALCLPALAQNKPQPRPTSADDQTLRIETQIVQVEVTVTDKQGKIIRDLKREDFELKEDGKTQDIAYFSVGTATRPARWLGTATNNTNNKDTATGITKPSATETLAGRYIVLAIDDIHLSPGTLLQARQSLLKFVDQQVGSGDQVALVTTSGQLGMFQQFTNDREALKRAINRVNVQERQATTVFDVPRITPYQAELIDLGDADALELAVQEILRREGNIAAAAPPGGAASSSGSGNGGGRGGGSGGGSNSAAPTGISDRERAIGTVRSLARMITMQNGQYTTITLNTLQTIIRSLSALPGRKVMTFVTDGFFLNARSANTFEDLRRVIDAATRAGVVIYSLDARGLATTPLFDAATPSFGEEQPPGARARIENASLEALRNGPFALANDTGGFLVTNTNDLNLGFEKVLQDTEMYYLLAFEPVEAYRDGRFRRLEVRVKNHPEYKVRSSKGYFATDEKAEAKAIEKEEKERVKIAEERAKNPDKTPKRELAVRNTRVWEALGSLFPLRGIPVEMSVDFVDTGKGASFALILAHLDVSGLKFEQVQGQYQATLEVLGTVFDEKGKTVDTFTQRLNMNLQPATYERVMQSGLVFSRQVLLKPGFYQVRLAVLREGNKQTGSASDWVEISDVSKKQLALSSIFLTTEKETNYLMAQLERKSTNSAPTQEPAPIPTQVARRFKAGASFDFSIFAYNAKPDAKGATDLVVQSQIFSGSKVIFASPLAKVEQAENLKGENYAPYAARLSLQKFEPGAYELRLLVIDRIAKVSAKRTLNFVIEP